MQRAVLAVVIAVLMTGAGIGITAHALTQQGATPVSAVPAAPITEATVMPTATMQPTIRPGARGSIGRVKDSVAFVEWLGLVAYERADNDRDSKGTSRVLGIFETLIIDGTVPIRVVDRVGTSAHVEFLDGPYRGRRGWMPATWILP